MLGLTTGLPLDERQQLILADLKSYLDETFERKHEGATGETPEWSSPEQWEWVLKYNQKLAQDGWLTPHWPKEYGGRGWSFLDQMLIREELAYRRIALVNANGLDMIAPILLRFGTEEQKRQHLPGIGAAQTLWCQGYSEPEAGSDLTSLRTTAVRDGDYYVVNGSKIWTGHAMHASWMILLCRTDPGSKGSRGLSLLLVDLKNTEGIDINPIRALTGGVTFCQEFFADARVPVANRVGEENGGWRASRALLEHERAGVGGTAAKLRQLDDILRLVKETSEYGLTSHDQSRLGKLIEQVECARAMAYQLASRTGEGFPPHMPSVMKIFMAELGTKLSEFAVEALGMDVYEWAPEAGSWNFWNEYLYSLISPIAGGSNEIQKEIIGLRRFGIARS